MRTSVGIILALGLFACGGESNTEVNEGKSSIVANEGDNTNSSNLTQQVTNEPARTSPVQAEGTTSIEYMETIFDFGDVMYPSENIHTFKFKNTGSTPLVIESARASCGCTVPNKPEEPILPGETGEMDVIFKPKEGQQGQAVTKKVTVTANTEPKQTYLEIKANVMPSMMNE